MTYSIAANTYADEHHGDADQSNWYHARDNVRAFVRAAFDAGAASVTVRAEPITTAAELDALPVGSIVFDDPDPWQKYASGDWGSQGHGYWTSDVLARNGPLTLLAPAPVLLTADDPRIRDGAKAETRRAFTIGEPGWSESWVTEVIRADGARVYLLAEAPDPDADARRALEIAIGLNVSTGRVPELAVEVLATLRDNDYDVTKRVES